MYMYARPRALYLSVCQKSIKTGKHSIMNQRHRDFSEMSKISEKFQWGYP